MKTCMNKSVVAAFAAVLLVACGPKEFTFIQMSDPQVGFLDTTEGYRQSDSLMSLAVNAINRIQPAVVLITGDLVNNTADSLQKAVYKRNIASIDPAVPVYANPGNHDMRPWTPENHEAFLEFNGYDRYSFKLNGCAFIGFDSCCIKDGIEEQEAEQLEWLKKELAAAKGSRYIFLFTHCPVFRENIDEDEDYFNFSKPKRAEYLKLFEEYGVSALFAGHTHKDYRAKWNGIELITAGPVGSPLHGGYSGLNIIQVGRDGFSCSYSPLQLAGRKAQLVAHRGGRYEAEENTLPAFSTALEEGITGYELDVHRTADGQYVIMHDSKITRMVDADGVLETMTLDQIKSLRTKQGNEIPTLDEVLALFKQHPGIYVEFEMKTTDISLYPEPVLEVFAEDVYEAISGSRPDGSTYIFSSFDTRVLKLLKDRHPEIEVMLITAQGNTEEVRALAAGVGAHRLACYRTRTTKEQMDKSHRDGWLINLWPNANPADVSLSMALGADYVCTDVPREICRCIDNGQFLIDK